MNYKGKIFRALDANINRSKEGLRVCEDLMRLVVEDKENTQKLRNLRHKISRVLSKSKVYNSCRIIQYRDSSCDIGRENVSLSSKGKIIDIFLANAQRVKEAIRVIEELTCLFDKHIAVEFQRMRFDFYGIEKKCVERIGYLRNIRFCSVSKRKAGSLLKRVSKK